MKQKFSLIIADEKSEIQDMIDLYDLNCQILEITPAIPKITQLKRMLYSNKPELVLLANISGGVSEKHWKLVIDNAPKASIVMVHDKESATEFIRLLSNFLNTNKDEIKNEHTQKALLKATNKLELLHKIDKVIQNAATVEELCTNTLSILGETDIYHDHSCIALIDKSEEKLHFISVNSRAKRYYQIKPGMQLPLSSLKCIDALKQDRSCCVKDLSECVELSDADQMILKNGQCSYLVQPLIYKSTLIGILILDSVRKRKFTTEQIEVISELSGQLSLAITELVAREELVENEQLMRVIYEQAPVGIAKMDSECNFKMVNDKMCEIFGYSHNKMLEISLFNLSDPSDLALIKDMQERFMKASIKRNFQYSKSFVHKKGHVIYVNSMFTYIEQGDNGYYIAVFEDVTGRVRAHKKLESLNKELNTFIYKASHDLKGPLASISGLASLGIDSMKDEGSKEYFRMMHFSIARLNNILDELLFISRCANATIHLEELNIKKLIEERYQGLSYSDYAENIKF